MTEPPGDSPRAPAASAAPAPAADRFAAVYEGSFGFVWRTLRRLGVAPAQLDDAAQDVFLVVHRRLAEVPAGEERPWLFGVVRRVAADQRRSAQRRGAEPLDAVPEPAAAGAGPDADAERAQAARVVHALLERLSDEQREVFVLAELEQLGAPEIAAALAVPLNTVYSRLRAARAAFDKHRARWAATRGQAR